jgi:hypothetical protein
MNLIRYSGGNQMKKYAKLFLLPLVVLSLSVSCASKKDIDPELLSGPGWTPEDNNLHQIEGPPPGKDAEMAFRLYRSGAPTEETFAKWCDEYKIKRVIDMAGTADKNELVYQEQGICPDIEIIYSVKQNPGRPVSDGFIELFDEEIQRAKDDKVGILFRCTTGSHRVGRAAAYYQMKHQDLSADEAIAVMDYNGMMMRVYTPVLRPQVRALNDYIKGESCSQDKRFCVEMDSDKWVE